MVCAWSRSVVSSFPLFTAISLDQDRKSLGQQWFCHVLVHSCLDTFLSNDKNGEQKEALIGCSTFAKMLALARLQHLNLVCLLQIKLFTSLVAC